MNSNDTRAELGLSPIHFVVVKAADKDRYKGGPGYRGPELKELGFPLGPYSLAGAKALVVQAKKLNPKLNLVVVPFQGDYW